MIDFGFGITLRPLNENSKVNEWRNDPKIWRWTRQNDLISLAEQKDWFERQSKDPTIQMYGIWKEDYIVGVCGFTSINHKNRNAEFSLYIAPSRHGERLSKPTLLTLFSHGFKNMGLKCIWGETFEGNRAARLFEQVGMTFDGKRRQFYWKDGHFNDAYIYCILDVEFFHKNGSSSCFG